MKPVETCSALDWLLEGADNPAVAYRARTELLGEGAGVSLAADASQTIAASQAAAWIYGKLPDNWHEISGLWYRYYLSALAECGLDTAQVERAHVQRAFTELDSSFDLGCGDLMLLRALVRLGYADEPAVRRRLDSLTHHALPDGGYLCLHRLKKLKHAPKSCYKANLYALLLAGECRKLGVPLDDGALARYFLSRDIFYRSDDRSALVLGGRPGWRAVDVFHPFETMRVGLHNIVEALCALGLGHEPQVLAAREMLRAKRDEAGRVILEGTLTKSYLPKERVGKPSKWATLYALLAEKHAAR